jgi:hypothetical protein
VVEIQTSRGGRIKVDEGRRQFASRKRSEKNNSVIVSELRNRKGRDFPGLATEE